LRISLRFVTKTVTQKQKTNQFKMSFEILEELAAEFVLDQSHP